jgi:hypothetical protein
MNISGLTHFSMLATRALTLNMPSLLPSARQVINGEFNNVRDKLSDIDISNLIFDVTDKSEALIEAVFHADIYGLVIEKLIQRASRLSFSD